MGIFEAHPKFGYAHKPNSIGRHVAPLFDVKYTIGSERERVIDAPESPRGRILFLGASFTFGWGVEDNQTYPYVLATGEWKDWHVVNKAVNGWGTAHAYMLLGEELESTTPPDMMIYSMIPDHVCRNYIRTAWLKMLGGSDRGHPHFELLHGKPRFQRVVQFEDAVEDEAVVRQKELALTAAFITEMNQLAEAAEVPFFVVLLPQRFEVACGSVDWPPSLFQMLGAGGVSLVDLSEVKPQMQWLDAHPTAEGHRILAKAIAESAAFDVLVGAAPR